MFTSPLQFVQKKSWQRILSSSETTDAEQLWRSLLYFNLYRVVVASGLVIITWVFYYTSLGSRDHGLFSYAAFGYLILSSTSILLLKLRYPNFDWQLMFQVSSDIVFMCVITYASGGMQSGLGVLLLVSLACSGLISRGRLALFFASIASMSMLFQETYAFFYINDYQPQYMQAGLLSMGYFAVAWLAHRLAIHAVVNEQLALERGTDLEKMSKINQLVIQDMQDGVLVVDKNGKIRHRNTCAESLLGLKAELKVSEQPMLADCAPALASRLSVWRDNTRINFDLLRLPVSNILVRTRFVQVEEGSCADSVIFLEDMSRIQAQVQQLKLAALGRLTANIAHEIRNPLSAINHATELLEEEQHENPTFPRLLRIICDNTQRVNKIVQDVLQLNRRDIVTSEMLDVADFIGTFITDFCIIEKMERDTFILGMVKSCLIRFDPGHLNQILWNLCRNAWRHCHKKKGSIQINLSPGFNGNSIMLDIIDDGLGVTSTQLKNLFEPFFTTVANGTGLGLYIAREMCEANHASLEYVENNIGGQFRIICSRDADHA